MKIAINCIATGKYIEFIPQLIYSIDQYFLIGHEITVNIFTDAEPLPCVVINTTRLYLIQHKIPAYGWPDATLLRFHTMLGIDYDCDMIYYLDADMRCVDYIGDEILGDLVAVRHPGYFMEKGSGSWETREDSQCYVPLHLRTKYFAGGFNGGKKDVFILAMNEMKEWIQADLDKGIIPIWQDESAFNCLIAFTSLLTSSDKPVLTELNPSYCMPESISKRKYSNIEKLPAKILALEKDFNYFRG